MTERLLSVDAEPIEGYTIRPLLWGGHRCSLLLGSMADRVATELDRLYAAAEANQAPGPDWKAKLREEVEASRDEASGTGYRAGLAEALARIDALPDPPTPDEAVRTSGAKLVSGPGTFDEFASLKAVVLGQEAELDELRSPPTPDPDAPPVGVERVAAERRRQIEAEGWTPEHDDQHVHGEMAAAAVCYAMHADPDGAGENAADFWPWDPKWWKPTGDSIRDLTKAGALIAAEIDRLIRAETAASPIPQSSTGNGDGEALADGTGEVTTAGECSGSPATDDAPPVYVPPEGHVAPVLGRDVPDGWEGRWVTEGGLWRSAVVCRDFTHYLFEVRRVPAPEPATEWVPLTKLVGRTIKGETKPVTYEPYHVRDRGWHYQDSDGWAHAIPVNLDTGLVEVLAEGER